MVKFSKHLNVLTKIKSFIKKGTIKSAKDSEEVSSEVANVIQASSYSLLKNYKKDKYYTPIYKVIAEQLSSNNNQIFSSAVYNLAKIAHNNTKDRDEIILLLKEQLELNLKDSNIERSEYVSRKLKEIK